MANGDYDSIDVTYFRSRVSFLGLDVVSAEPMESRAVPQIFEFVRFVVFLSRELQVITQSIRLLSAWIAVINIIFRASSCPEPSQRSSRERQKVEDRRIGACFKCGRKGHKQRDCSRGRSRSRSRSDSYGSRRRRRGGSRERRGRSGRRHHRRSYSRSQSYDSRSRTPDSRDHKRRRDDRDRKRKRSGSASSRRSASRGSAREKYSNKSRSVSPPRYRKKSRSPSASVDSYRRPAREDSYNSRQSAEKFRNGDHINGKDSRDVLNPEKRPLNDNVE